MSEEMKETSGTTEETTAIEPDRKGKLFFLKKIKTRGIIRIIAAILIVAGVSSVMYVNSDAHKANQQIKLALKYIDELEYEQAVAAFQKALELDPNNEKIQSIVSQYIHTFYQIAQEYGSEGNYSDQLRLAICVLELDKDYLDAKILKAEAQDQTGDTEGAIQTCKDVLKDHPEEERIMRIYVPMVFRPIRIIPERKGGFALDYEEVLKKLFELCKGENWEEIIQLMESDAFVNMAAGLTDDEEIALEDEEKYVAVRKRNGESYVYVGAYNEEIYCGEPVSILNGTGVFVGKSTYTVYTGEWSGKMPSGIGTMAIWEKSESYDSAMVYFDSYFLYGLGEGKIQFKTEFMGEEVDTYFLAENIFAYESDGMLIDQISNVKVYGTDANGGLWLNEETTENGCVPVAAYVNEDNGKIADFVFGVPFFGGSEKILDVSLSDVEPPVISCSKNMGVWYSGKPDYISGITAQDNMDGDITDRIQIDKSELDEGQWWTTGDVVYTVVDSAGNETKLTIWYNWDGACGDEYEIYY